MYSHITGTNIFPTEGHKLGYKFHYYFKYFPSRYSVSAEDDNIRKLIWNFKDGQLGHLIAENMAKDISQLGVSSNIKDWNLCVIPASTQQKTEMRFKLFCDTFCIKTGIINGFKLLVNKVNRESIHKTTVRGELDIDTIEFGLVAGRNILLFDDIYTTGNSFYKISKHLKNLGANQVVGLFLGKTHWLEDNDDKQKYMSSFDLNELCLIAKAKLEAHKRKE